jgi:hypothetical protein
VRKGASISKQQSVEIRRHEARFNVETPATLSYYPKEAIGYWFQEKWGMEIPSGDEPLTINVPVLPAGAIHGSVVNADGSDVDNVLVSIVTVDKPAIITGSLGIEGKNSAKPNDGPTLFSIQPLPLNGKYVVVAHRNRCFVASEVMELNEQNPIKQTTLKLVKGISLDCTVFDENKKPLPGVFVGLGYSTPYSCGFGVAQPQATDQDGKCTFLEINPDIIGYYAIEIDGPPGYRPIRQKIENVKVPVQVFMEKAEILCIKAVHFETGQPIPDASFYLLPEDFSNPEITGYLNAEANSNAKGEFRFSNLARRAYNLNLRDGEITNGKERSIPIMGGKDTNVVVKVKPR